MNKILFDPSKHRVRRMQKDAWRQERLPTLTCPDDFVARVHFIMDRLRSEPWLPSSIRFKIANRCESMLYETEYAGMTPNAARAAVERLASEIYEFDELTLKSSTFCQIRALDLELNIVESELEKQLEFARQTYVENSEWPSAAIA